MNILMVYQSVLDTWASFLTLLLAVVDVKHRGLSHDSVHDQFICHVWLGRQLLWYITVVSTYGMILMTFDRYMAVIRPIWYKNSVRELLTFVADVASH